MAPGCHRKARQLPLLVAGLSDHLAAVVDRVGVAVGVAGERAEVAHVAVLPGGGAVGSPQGSPTAPSRSQELAQQSSCLGLEA